MTASEHDLHFLRMTIDFTRLSERSGHLPLGAMVVEAGDILAKASSNQAIIGDPTGHAEMNAVRIAQAAVSRSRLESSTIYTSHEPCPMCTAAIFYSGIGRIVFGLEGPKLRISRGKFYETPELIIGCREVLSRAGRAVAVIGPLMKEEAGRSHQQALAESISTAGNRSIDSVFQKQIKSEDERLLRKAFALAEEARSEGELPFGAIVVSDDGRILAEAKSTELSLKDWTCHAETNAVRLVGPKANSSVLASATIYASSEPCAMCASAIYYSGIRRIVFGFAETDLRALLGSAETAGLGFSCREILSSGTDSVEVVGPILGHEASKPHQGFWISS